MFRVVVGLLSNDHFSEILFFSLFSIHIYCTIIVLRKSVRLCSSTAHLFSIKKVSLFIHNAFMLLK